MKAPFKTTSTIIGCVEDVDGHLHWCNEARETKHGFYIWRGWRDDQSRVGSPPTVLTKEIADHLAKYNYVHKAVDLPLTEGVLRRFRKRLGVVNPRDKAYREYKKRNTPPPLIKKDIEGTEYKVTWHQSCDLGIIIYRGTQVDRDYPSPQYILTPELAAVIKEWAEFPIKLSRILPFDIHTLNTLRRRVGLDWQQDRLLWWGEKLDDLLALPVKEFAAKYDRTAKTVHDERHAIRYVLNRLEEPELYVEFFIQMKADWSDKTQNIKKKLGKEYIRLRRYRKAYNILKLAGRIDEAA